MKKLSSFALVAMLALGSSAALAQSRPDGSGNGGGVNNLTPDCKGAACSSGFILTQTKPDDGMRAALRRAWTADPAIRDFIGLSENSWDFNSAGGVPAFGSLQAEDVHKLLGEALPAKLAETPAGARTATVAVVSTKP